MKNSKYINVDTIKLKNIGNLLSGTLNNKKIREIPRYIKIKTKTYCAETGKELSRGETCLYFPDEKKIYSLESEKAKTYIIESKKIENVYNPETNVKADFDINSLDPNHMAIYLSEHPEHADKFKIKKVYNADAAHTYLLINRQPQFAIYCNLNKLKDLPPEKTLSLAQDLPQFARYCNLRKLNAEQTTELIIKNPPLTNDCDLGKLQPVHINKITTIHPFLKEKLQKSLMKSKFTEALEKLFFQQEKERIKQQKRQNIRSI